MLFPKLFIFLIRNQQGEHNTSGMVVPIMVFSHVSRFSFLLTTAYPLVDGLFVKSPDTTNPDSGDFALSSILADRYFVQLQVLG
jgi:hypothetical protein